MPKHLPPSPVGVHCPSVPVSGYRLVVGVRAAVDVGTGKQRHHARRTLDHVVVMKRIRRSIINPPPVEFM